MCANAFKCYHICVCRYTKYCIYCHMVFSVTLSMVFSAIYYLELRNAIIIYCASHFLLSMVELVVWIL